MGLCWVMVMGVMGMMVSALPFDPYDCTDYCEDDPIDSLIHLQDHIEREANIDKEDHFHLPDHNISQPPPHTPMGIKKSEAVPSYSVAGLIKNHHPKQSIWVDTRKNIVNEINNTNPLSQGQTETNNVYYLFASKAEWELAEWFSSASLPQSSINNFLHLNWVCLVHYAKYQDS